jgi:hypothetical protein
MVRMPSKMIPQRRRVLQQRDFEKKFMKMKQKKQKKSQRPEKVGNEDEDPRSPIPSCSCE